MTKTESLFLALCMIFLIVAPAYPMPADENFSNAPKGPAGHQHEHMAPPGSEDERHPPLIRWVWRGSGFALGDEEHHLLKIQVANVRSFSPCEARRLLKENKSLEEIRAEIAKGDESFVYLGHILLGETIYKLVDIDLTCEGENAILYAEVAELQGDMTPVKDEIVGRIEIATCLREGAWIGEGELSMDGGEHPGDFAILLEMSSPDSPCSRPTDI